MVLTKLHCYRAFGMTIRSEIPLPELPADNRPHQEAELTVTLEPLETPPEQNGPPGTLYPVAEGEYRMDVEAVGSYLVQGGRRIAIAPFPGVRPEVVRLFLLGTALGAVLHQRSGLALHASAVDIEGQAVLLMGDSGVGKSTTVAALVQRGYTLLADDVTYLVQQSGRTMVHQGVQRVKLWQESAEALGIAPASLTEVHPDFPSRRSMATPGGTLGSLPLGAIFLLTPGESQNIALQRLAGAESLSALLQNTYRPTLAHQLCGAASHIGKISTVAREATICKLHRPAEGMSLTEVVSAVLKHSKEHRTEETYL